MFFELDQLRSGIDTMDRAAIRGSAWFWGWVHGVNPKIILGIIHNESNGDPRNYVGDNGASLGPGNIQFATWVDAGNGTDRATYESRQQAGHEYAGVEDVVRTFKWVRDTGHGSLGPVDDVTALALYNGGPVGYRSTAAQNYASRALGFAQGLA